MCELEYLYGCDFGSDSFGTNMEIFGWLYLEYSKGCIPLFKSGCLMPFLFS